MARPPRLPGLGGRIQRPALALAVGAAIELALAAVDVAADSGNALVATLLLAPLVVGLLAGPRATGVVALIGVALALAAGGWNDDFGSTGYWVRFAVLLIGSALATMGAGARIRTGEALQRFELLAHVGEVADGTMSLAETVDRLLDLLVPEFADIAVLDAGGDPASLRRLGARVDAPNAHELEAALLRRRIVSDAPVGAPYVAATARSQLLAAITDAHLQAIAGAPEDLELLRALGMRSFVFVPLRARGRMVGTLGCGTAAARSYDEGDLRFAEVLSGRVALALDNAGLTAEVTSLERRFEATLQNLGEAVTVQDPDGRTVFANPAAVELLRAGSTDELVGADPDALMDRFEVTHEDGRHVAPTDLPAARVLAGELPPALLVRNVVRATGQERWLVNKATPVRDADGSVALVANVIEDVTEVKRAEFAQRLLAEASQVLSSSLDYESTLQRVAGLAVPELADWCGVTMPDASGVLRSVAVAHRDPGRVAAARELAERYPSRTSDASGAAEVIRSGVSQLVNEIPDDLLVEAAEDPRHLELLRGIGMRAALIVPLATGQETLGALTLVEAESGRAFTGEGRALAEELGRRAAIAVQNARLYGERSAIAETLQRGLLPSALPHVSGWEMASLYRPAGRQNDVGGDFYDAFEVPTGWLVVVGDVAGRGAEAATLTSLARYTLRASAELLDDPLAAMTRLNVALRERDELSLVSMCCALLCVREGSGEAEAEVVCAGHPLPYRIRAGEPPDQVGAFGPFLGAFDDSEWRPVRVPLARGDQLVLYTDGVIDAVGAADRFGEARLGETLGGSTGAADAVRRIDRALSLFESGSQRDDTAVLAVGRTAAVATPAGDGGVSLDPVHETFTVAGGIDAPRTVRARVRPHVEPYIADELVLYDVELLVAEVVTNAVRHGGAEHEQTTIDIDLRVDRDAVRFEAADPGPGFVKPADPQARTSGGGNGFVLLERMAASWGVAVGERTRVWFAYDLRVATS